jgi:3-carboxy-cis,cis-muconate cycloisomerase
LAVATYLAEDLSLDLPDVPWHVHRDRVAEIATTLGLLVGTLGKVARDITLMMQTEVGEAFEPSAPGKGGSSTLPHKRNPVGSAAVLAAAVRVPGLVSVMLSAMVQEHERGLGNWHAEWETLPEICVLASGALAHMTDVLTGLEVDATRMKANWETSSPWALLGTLTAALGAQLGRPTAEEVVHRAVQSATIQNRPVRDVLIQDPLVRQYLPGDEVERLLDAGNHIDCAERMVDRVLAVHRRRT